MVRTNAHRITRRCTQRGLLDDTPADTDEKPVLAALTAASVWGDQRYRERVDQRLRRTLKDPATGVRTAPLCFALRGFTINMLTAWFR